MSSIVHLTRLPSKDLGRIVGINGKTIKTVEDYLYCLGEQLEFPDYKTCNWDGYLDWMRDLSWIKEKHISIVVKDFDSFLCKEPAYHKHFLYDMDSVVFPFWKNDAKAVFEDEEKIKDIMIYCFHKELLPRNIAPLKNAATIIRKAVLNGNSPYLISQPVLRWHEGKLCLAVFVVFFTYEEIKTKGVSQTKMVRMPTMGITSDIKTGEILYRSINSSDDISSDMYKSLYNISPENLPPASKLFWDSTYALMDLIRLEYVNYGTLNTALYQEYFGRILRNTPEDFRAFYSLLSNVKLQN